MLKDLPFARMLFPAVLQSQLGSYLRPIRAASSPFFCDVQGSQINPFFNLP